MGRGEGSEWGGVKGAVSGSGGGWGSVGGSFLHRQLSDDITYYMCMHMCMCMCMHMHMHMHMHVTCYLLLTGS